MSSHDANPSPAGDPTIRSNIVYIVDTSKTIVDVQQNGQWMVSAGQPSTPPPKITPNPSSASYEYTIEFDAGRSDTSPVAGAFNSLCGGVSHQWCVSSFDSSPSALNFYFGLNLFLKSGDSSAEVQVYLAQGSNWSNNWWIGGSCISNRGALSTTINGETVTLYIQPFATDTNGFTFTSYPPNSPD